MEDKKAMLIEKKMSLIELINHTEEAPKLNFFNFLSEKIDHDYTYLANLFSKTEGLTIEYFIIYHKIESVKNVSLTMNLTLMKYLGSFTIAVW